MEKERDIRNECYHCVNKEEVPGNCHIKCVKPDAEMVGNPHGINHGWFFYPLLFDPVWKEKMCSNYEEKDIPKVVSESVSLAGKST